MKQAWMSICNKKEIRQQLIRAPRHWLSSRELEGQSQDAKHSDLVDLELIRDGGEAPFQKVWKVVLNQQLKFPCKE